jgi:ankyrin repeat protein
MKNELTQAINSRDLPKVQRLIAQGANVNNDGSFYPPIFAAISNGIDFVRILVTNRADVNIFNILTGRPIHSAIRINDFEIVRYLISQGADVNDVTYFGGPLHIAANSFYSIEIVKLLLDKGADINIRDHGGHTPLHYATSSLETTKTLVSRGANVNIQDNQGNTPLHRAINDRRTLEVIKYLISQGARTDIANKKGVSPIQLAQQSKDSQIREYFQGLITNMPGKTIPSFGKTVNSEIRYLRTF